MTSLLRSTREVSNNTGYYIPLADIRTSLLAYNPADGVLQFSTAKWANQSPTGEGYASSLVAAAGLAVLKDMGKTVISSTRVFRRVQLVVPTYPSTFGVGGGAGTVGNTNGDFLTAYIELGFEGGGAPAKVAQFGR